jgi:hypothetical protein
VSAGEPYYVLVTSSGSVSLFDITNGGATMVRTPHCKGYRVTDIPSSNLRSAHSAVSNVTILGSFGFSLNASVNWASIRFYTVEGKKNNMFLHDSKAKAHITLDTTASAQTVISTGCHLC